MSFDPVKAARTSDPQTSKDAAASMVGHADTIKAEILRAMRDRRSFPLLSEEIADTVNRPHGQVWKRISELLRDGSIKAVGFDTARSGRKARTFVIV
jgi:DNA-binding Lrp family transcriptional regulator